MGYHSNFIPSKSISPEIDNGLKHTFVFCFDCAHANEYLATGH
jgi:hypothetical protein